MKKQKLQEELYSCICIHIYTLEYPRISRYVAAMTKFFTNDSWLSFSGWPISLPAFWKATLFSFVCLFSMVYAWSILERGLFRKVHALDLEKGNNSNACNSILSGSVWGQIYWADLVFQYFVAVGYRSSTPDFFQNQSLLTFVKLMKNFHMLKCWFFQQHLTS